MKKENRFSFGATFTFPLMNALVYADIDQGIHKGKSKVAPNEKRLHGFSFFINIANFETFGWTFLLSTNLFFLEECILCIFYIKNNLIELFSRA